MLVLGSSLNITPACQIPSKTVAAGGKLVIVNLQPTKLDKVNLPGSNLSQCVACVSVSVYLHLCVCVCNGGHLKWYPAFTYASCLAASCVVKWSRVGAGSPYGGSC